MANLRQTPLTCSGHTRPVVHLAFSDVTESGYYLISACKGKFNTIIQFYKEISKNSHWHPRIVYLYVNARCIPITYVNVNIFLIEHLTTIDCSILENHYDSLRFGSLH